MAVPKKRTGHSAQGSRRSNWKATKPETTKCPNCGATVLAHTACTACGTYKGKPISIKDRVEEKAEVKKPAKKATKKKTEKVEEVKTEVVEEAKAEEVKAEETKAEKTEAKADETTEK